MNNSYQNTIGNRWRGYFLSAYGIAVKHGFKGTEADWLLSLTAYGIALELGFVGTKAEWIASLKGEKGDPFTFYDFTEEQLEELKTAIAGAVLADAEAAKEAAEGAQKKAEDAKAEAESAVDVINAITKSAEKAKEEANSYYLQAEYQAGEADGFARAAGKSMRDAADYASNALGSAQSADASALSAAESARNAAQNAVDVKKNCANALRGKLFGASVSADDVSPIEHELDIKLTGENVGGTKVIRLGKNFANLAGLSEYDRKQDATNTRGGYCVNDDGSITITTSLESAEGGSNVSTRFTLKQLCPDLQVGMTVRLNVVDTIEEGASSGNGCIYIVGTGTVWVFSQTDDRNKLTITQAMLDRSIYLYGSYTPGAKRTLSNFQIELESISEYEPYKEPTTAVADADGNVSGLMSLSPGMTLITDNESAVIECAYNRDTNKVIEELTNAIISLGGNI